jgi:Protein of unknown function (DUF3102)
MALPAVSLHNLAEQINAEHERFEAAARESLVHARNAGQLLLDAKGRLRHGEWLPWLRAHCRVPERTAQAYMRVAARWAELGESATVADLTFSQALKLLTHTADGTGGESAPREAVRRTCHYTPFFQIDPAGRQKMTTTWWDLQAKYTVLLDALGWDVERIAEFMGRPAGELELTLTPRPPVRFDSEFNGSALVRPLAMQGAYQEVYGSTVEQLSSGMLGVIYGHAAYAADLEEEFNGLGDQMRHLQRYHEKRAKRLKDRTIFRSSFCGDEVLADAGWCCALTDARSALGIEPHQEPRRLLLLLKRFIDAARELPRPEGN